MGEPNADELESVRRHALQLLAGLPRLPSLLRIRAGEVCVELEWSAGTDAPAPATTVADPVPDRPSDRRYIFAPSVGVFYQASEPSARPFVGEGDTVVPGQQVGIVEAMKLMIPVTSPVHGRIIEVLRNDGDTVEYDEPLFAVAEHAPDARPDERLPTDARAPFERPTAA